MLRTCRVCDVNDDCLNMVENTKLKNVLATFIYASGSGEGYISQPIFVTHASFYLLIQTNYSKTCIYLGF